MAEEQKILIPDIGGASGVDVIEILVKEGDPIHINTPLVTLESDKASMEIPSSVEGIVRAIKIKVGDKVSEGDWIMSFESNQPKPAEDTDTKESAKISMETEVSAEIAPVEEEAKPREMASSQVIFSESDENALTLAAGPGVRRLARELGLDLSKVSGTGRKSRVMKEDVIQYVKNKINQPASQSGMFIPETPVIDFSKFGHVEIKPLNKIKRLTGANVHRSWVTIPHVTQFDEADITELEVFRKAEAEHSQSLGYKLTILAFVCKVVSKALAVFPQFNASLDASGENLVYKHYFNIGIAVETPHGLVVPVIKDVDRLSVGDIAKEMARLSSKARDKGLMPTDMSGGCFTISSLGGIGGTGFTPIVNSPEVAILGLSRSSMKPVYCSGEFKPRLMLPLSLSYDHRVIDGAEAARFTRYISESLGDIRRILL